MQMTRLLQVYHLKALWYQLTLGKLIRKTSGNYYLVRLSQNKQTKNL